MEHMGFDFSHTVWEHMRGVVVNKVVVHKLFDMRHGFGCIARTHVMREKINLSNTIGVGQGSRFLPMPEVALWIT